MADDETEATRTGDAELTNMPTKTRVRRAAYCGVCTMPVEYCEFGADYSSCRKWFSSNWRQVLPDEEAKALLGLEPAGELSPDKLVALMSKLGLDGRVDDHAKRAQKSGKKTAGADAVVASADAAGEAAAGEAGEGAAGAEGEGGGAAAAIEGGGGGKKKKGKEPTRMVVIELTTRNKKKHITVIKGLEGYPEVDMAAAAKGFGKKFACGCAFQKGKNGQADQIEIQGDALDALPAFIADKHKVPLDEIYVVVDGKKVRSTEVRPAEA